MADRHVPVSMGSERSTTTELPGLRISDVWFPASALLPDHTHDRAVFAVALEGSLDSRLPGRRLDCPAGCVWTEPAGERHSNRVGGHGARVLVVMPDPAVEDPHRACARILTEVNHWQDRGIAGIAWRMVAELRARDAPARLALNGLALEALAIALRGRTFLEDRDTMPAWLIRARDLVHDRFLQALELGEIASEIGVEPARLTRAFRHRFGTTLGAYQRQLRLDWAAGELAATAEPLGRLALRAGFYDQAHFTRHFRRHTGQTPGQYRRTHRTGQMSNPVD